MVDGVRTNLSPGVRLVGKVMRVLALRVSRSRRSHPALRNCMSVGYKGRLATLSTGTRKH